MKARNLIICGALIVLAGLGTALWQHRRGQAAERLAQISRQRAAAAAAELRQLAARHLQFARGEGVQALRRQAEAASSYNPPDLRAEDPEALRQAVARARATAALRYRALFQALHLPPGQEKRLAEIVEDYELRARDIWEEGNAEGMSTADPALWRLMRPDYEKMKADVTALIGDAGFQQVDEYNRSLVAHDFSSALVSALYYGNTPLTAPQAADLPAAIAKLSPAYQQGHSAIDLYTMDWSAAYPQLNTILMPPQLAALQAVVSARQAYVKLTPLLGVSTGYVVNAAAQNPGSPAPANNR
ncbi:MAG TPA: hypothetical protein VHV47_03085 [Opitutaceae bacterium]|jgi:hypothetical protein|nr:hypothetical protein [Opitutaceae bacterium]